MHDVRPRPRPDAGALQPMMRARKRSSWRASLRWRRPCRTARATCRTTPPERLHLQRRVKERLCALGIPRYRAGAGTPSEHTGCHTPWLQRGHRQAHRAARQPIRDAASAARRACGLPPPAAEFRNASSAGSCSPGVLWEGRPARRASQCLKSAASPGAVPGRLLFHNEEDHSVDPARSVPCGRPGGDRRVRRTERSTRSTCTLPSMPTLTTTRAATRSFAVCPAAASRLVGERRGRGRGRAAAPTPRRPLPAPHQPRRSVQAGAPLPGRRDCRRPEPSCCVHWTRGSTAITTPPSWARAQSLSHSLITSLPLRL